MFNILSDFLIAKCLPLLISLGLKTVTPDIRLEKFVEIAQ